jgi:hypothetical protein
LLAFPGAFRLNATVPEERGGATGAHGRQSRCSAVARANATDPTTVRAPIPRSPPPSRHRTSCSGRDPRPLCGEPSAGILGDMFVRCYVELPLPPDQVEAALLDASGDGASGRTAWHGATLAAIVGHSRSCSGQPLTATGPRCGPRLVLRRCPTGPSCTSRRGRRPSAPARARPARVAPAGSWPSWPRRRDRG